MFDTVDTASSYEWEFFAHSAGFLQGKRKWLVINLRCTYSIFTLWGRFVTECHSGPCLLRNASVIAHCHKNKMVLSVIFSTSKISF